MNGAGDAIAALFFAHYLRSGKIDEALSRAASAIFGVLAKTAEAGAPRNPAGRGAGRDRRSRAACSRRKNYDDDAMNETASVVHIDRLELTVAPKPWAFADERRAEIDAYFAALQREKPAIWNGRVLLLHHQVVSDGVFRGAYLETDYASFAAWRHWGRPAAAVHDCFGAAAIAAADGAFLLGVMGAHTVNAGRIYFPCGTPDPDDIVGDQRRSRFQRAARAQGGNRTRHRPNSPPSRAGPRCSTCR